jgi:hypothetical protein
MVVMVDQAVAGVVAAQETIQEDLPQSDKELQVDLPTHLLQIMDLVAVVVQQLQAESEPTQQLAPVAQEPTYIQHGHRQPQQVPVGIMPVAVAVALITVELRVQVVQVAELPAKQMEVR